MKKLLLVLIVLFSLNASAQQTISDARSGKSVYQQKQTELKQFNDKLVKLKVALQHEDLTVVNMLKKELVSDMQRELDQEKELLLTYQEDNKKTSARVMHEQAEEPTSKYFGGNMSAEEREEHEKMIQEQIDVSIDAITNIGDKRTKLIEKNIVRQEQIIGMLSIYEFNKQFVESPENGSHLALIDEFETLMRVNTDRELRRARAQVSK